jgi:thermitase
MKIRSLFAKIASLSLLGLGLVSQGVWAQGSGGNQPSFVPGRILVKFKDGVADGQARLLLAGRGGLSINVIPQINVHVVQLPPNADEQAEANAFKGLNEVEFAEVDAILRPQAVTPNDDYYYVQWALPKISAPDAWSLTTGSTSVIIAIIDTGIDSTDIEFSGKLVPGWNIYGNNSNTADVTGHGTSVAGVAAANTNNIYGVAGVCWACMIMPIRVSDTTGAVTASNVAMGINWAADHGAKVANVSYAVTGNSTISSAAQYLQSKGGVLTSSSGDNGAFYSTPDDPYILTIGGTDPNDVIYSWSATGNDIDLVAPGCSYTTLSSISYNWGCGTSYSAPIVAGVAGLMLSVNPNLTPTQITNILKQTAVDLGAPGCDTTYGCGRVNALAAVTAALGNNPVPAINSLSPSSATVGAAAQPLTINGTGFLSSSTVTYNGVLHTPTFVSSTKLTISLSGPDQATVGNYAVLVTNPPPGGGSSNSVNFTVRSSNPVPTISSLSPSSATVGAATQTLTINGTGFFSSSTVTYNGVLHTPTFVSSTRLTISLSALDQATVGIYPVVVINPAPGGGSSNSFNFTVSSGNPVPTITSLSPSSTTAGAALQTLTINGTGFLSSSTVTYNGILHTPTPLSSTQLTISLNATDQMTVGNYPVVVTNPAPGGGSSNSFTFTVTSGTGGSPPPGFSISVSPSSQSVVRGSSISYTLTITPINGFTGNVGLSVSGLPSSTTPSFNPNPAIVGSSGVKSILTIATTGPPQGTPTGTVTLTIKATSSSLSSTTTTSLIVATNPNK